MSADDVVRAVGGIARASVESDSVEELLDRLAQGLSGTAPGIDISAILLHVGDHLVVRAASGTGSERLLGRSLRFGEGVSGTVAETRIPMLLRDADASSLLAWRDLVEMGTRAVFAAPLVAGGELLGVALMASQSPDAFAAADQRLFEALCTQAAAGLAVHRAQESLEAALTERQALLEEARSQSSQREQILAVVSHDLRTPLSTVLMSVSRIAAGAATGSAGDTARRAAELIWRSARRMERLIGDLLDVTAIQNGRLSVRPSPYTPGELAREAAETMQAVARAEEVEIRVNAPPNLPRVQADHDRVLQVLGNLVSNAIQVTTKSGHIEVRAEAVREGVRFSVRDEGPGISPADLPHLFDPYRRGQGARYRGTGLGLAIARGIVEAHGGRIGVDSRVGVGSTFWFDLPLALGQTVSEATQH